MASVLPTMHQDIIDRQCNYLLNISPVFRVKNLSALLTGAYIFSSTWVRPWLASLSGPIPLPLCQALDLYMVMLLNSFIFLPCLLDRAFWGRKKETICIPCIVCLPILLMSSTILQTQKQVPTGKG